MLNSIKAQCDLHVWLEGTLEMARHLCCWTVSMFLDIYAMIHLLTYVLLQF